MSKAPRRTPTARIEARAERSDLHTVLAAIFRGVEAQHERQRARFWLRLGAPEPPAITDPDRSTA